MNGIQLTITGNLTRDPEMQTLSSGDSLAKFSVAVERSWKAQSGEWEKVTSFVDVTCWKNLAEDAERLLEKGIRVMISGRFDQSSWDDKETGAKRTKFELTADDIAVVLRGINTLERRRSDGDASQNTGGRAAANSGGRASDDVWG
jgi:single-strand DNA-binding protein